MMLLLCVFIMERCVFPATAGGRVLACSNASLMKANICVGMGIKRHRIHKQHISVALHAHLFKHLEHYLCSYAAVSGATVATLSNLHSKEQEHQKQQDWVGLKQE